LDFGPGGIAPWLAQVAFLVLYVCVYVCVCV